MTHHGAAGLLRAKSPSRQCHNQTCMQRTSSELVKSLIGHRHMLSNSCKGLHRSLAEYLLAGETWGIRGLHKAARDLSESFISLPPVSFDEESGAPSGASKPAMQHDVHPSCMLEGHIHPLINSRCCSSPVVEEEGSPCIRVMQKPLGEGEESSPAGRRAPAADWSQQAPSRGGSAAPAQDSHSRVAYTKQTAHERC